jgi:hypothetical protein
VPADNLPFPIAYPYHLMRAGRDSATRYDRLLQCYEAVVRFCAAVQISDYRRAGCPDPQVNRRLLEHLPRKFLLGHWIELIRLITLLQRREVIPAFAPEMAAFYFKPGNKATLSKDAHLFDTLLSIARNAKAHPEETWADETYAQRFKEHRTLLDRLLKALDFLEDYTLYVPYRGPRADLLNEAYLLRGPATPPEFVNDLNLGLDESVSRYLEYETTPLLVSRKDPARQLLLYPLSVSAHHEDAEDIFLFDHCDLRHNTVWQLSYRGIRIGQKPLEVGPGSEYHRLVEHFQSWLGVLQGGSPPAEPPPVAEDLSAHYFSALEKLIEQHSQGFVGRAYVEQALDGFVAGHPRGYFIVSAGPGQGKTAVAAHLVKTRNCVHHFISRGGGLSDPLLILRSLLAQLLPLSRTETASLPETVPELSKLLEDVLVRTAARQKIVLVIDALDELPPDVGPDLPFLPVETLPPGAYVVVTTRPGQRLDELKVRLSRMRPEVYELGPLRADEVAAILHKELPGLTGAQGARIAEVSQGNALYLHAVVSELKRNPDFDLDRLPESVEDFFRGAVGDSQAERRPLLTAALGLLATARKPLSPRELAQITGTRRDQVLQEAVRPIRPFLTEAGDGYHFYHARFHDFVTGELFEETDLASYHRTLADWLERPENHAAAYRWQSLAYHLSHARDDGRLLRVLDDAFLAAKVRRLGYGVLEDVGLLTRALLRAGAPDLVETCVARVEALCKAAGGDLLGQTRQAVRGQTPGPAADRSDVLAPEVRSIPGGGRLRRRAAEDRSGGGLCRGHSPGGPPGAGRR